MRIVHGVAPGLVADQLQPLPAAASMASCTSSGGATVAVGSSAPHSTSSRGSPPSARILCTVSSSAYGSGTPPHSAGVATWNTDLPNARAWGSHQAAHGRGSRTSPPIAAVSARSRAGAPGAATTLSGAVGSPRRSQYPQAASRRTGSPPGGTAWGRVAAAASAAASSGSTGRPWAGGDGP